MTLFLHYADSQLKPGEPFDWYSDAMRSPLFADDPQRVLSDAGATIDEEFGVDGPYLLRTWNMASQAWAVEHWDECSLLSVTFIGNPRDLLMYRATIVAPIALTLAVGNPLQAAA